MKLWSKLKNGLAKTRQGVWQKVTSLFSGEINDDFFESLEEHLIQGDVGLPTTMKIIEQMEQHNLKNKDSDEVLSIFKKTLVDLLPEKKLVLAQDQLNVFLIAGVNGSGKTTSLAKLAYYFKNNDYKVLAAAADTYRAAAIEQLQNWADRLNFPLIAQETGSDAAAVAFDATMAAQKRKSDVLLIDTAGRLHTEKNLMAELEKIKRVVSKNEPNVKTLLVLDATNGQNALEQGKIFNQALTIDGLILTKLDGTAKGGIIFAIAKELGLPVYMIGLGEKPEDLKPFNREAFVENLLAEL